MRKWVHAQSSRGTAIVERAAIKESVVKEAAAVTKIQ
jgi:hypothetical protein